MFPIPHKLSPHEPNCADLLGSECFEVPEIIVPLAHATLDCG